MKEKIETLSLIRKDLNELLLEEYEEIQEYIKNYLGELGSVEGIKGFFKTKREEFLEETYPEGYCKEVNKVIDIWEKYFIDTLNITKKKQKTILKAIDGLL